MPDSTSAAQNEAAAPHVDWLAEAHRQAGIDAKRQIASDDENRRQAEALAASTHSPPGWSTAKQPRSRWKGWSERSKGFEASGGALLWHLNDHCIVGIFLIIPGFACQIGRIAPRTDLFAPLHDRVHFGDWKDR